MCKYTPKHGPSRLRWCNWLSIALLIICILPKHPQWFIKVMWLYIVDFINCDLSSRCTVFDVFLACFLQSPALVAPPTEILVTTLAPDHLALLLLLNYVPAMALLETKTKKLVLLKFAAPLITGEMLVRLFAARAKPSSADHTLKWRFLFYLVVLENLFAFGCGTEKVLFMSFDELFDPPIA